MSYSNSDKAVHKISGLLDSIAKCKGDSISWSSNDAVKLAYQLRQAIAICHTDKEKWAEFYYIKNIWKIKVRNNIVTASRIIPLLDLQDTLVTVSSFTQTVTAFEVPEVKEVMEVIGSVLDNPNFEEYLFPDYKNISEAELSRLYKWTSKNSYHIINSNFLVLTKRELTEDIQWAPTAV